MAINRKEFVVNELRANRMPYKSVPLLCCDCGEHFGTTQVLTIDPDTCVRIGDRCRACINDAICARIFDRPRKRVAA